MSDPGLQQEAEMGSLPATVKALNLAVNEVGILVGRLKRNVVTEVPEFVLQQWQGRMATQANTIGVLQERVEKSDSLLESRDQRIKELEGEGVAVVRLLHDIDDSGGFVTELATELSDRIDAVLEGE